MRIDKKIGTILLVLLPLVSYSSQIDYIVNEIDEFTTDSRIKTYIYNPNKVYLLMLHHGFQSNIEFAKNEKIQTISLGETYSWKITPMDNRIFIRPLEKNTRTNMTVITNTNQYQFDLVAQDFEDIPDSLMYCVKFYYPKKFKKNGQE